MKKLILLLVLTALVVSGFSQKQRRRNKRERDTWWTPYVGIHVLPANVYVTQGKPGIGYGSGHAVVWQIDKPEEKRVWLGFDFNYHYFGSIKKEDNRVFYEHWQFGPVIRVSIFNNARIQFFTDINAGIRSLASFTTYDRTYGGVFLEWAGEFIGELISGNSSNDTDDHILKRYERLDYFVGMAPGIAIWKKRYKDDALTIRCAINLGSRVRYVDRRFIFSENETIHYPTNKGIGMFFNVQLCHSFMTRAGKDDMRR